VAKPPRLTACRFVLAQVDDLFQIGAKILKVVGLAGLDPKNSGAAGAFAGARS